jgi:hypothetical protein
MTVILCNRGDEREVIEEARTEWLHEVLVALGVDESVFGDDIDKNEAREYLMSRDLEVWTHVDGSLNILRKDKVVAQWKAPKLTLRKEKSNEWYYEVKLEEWALPFQMSKRLGVSE